MRQKGKVRTWNDDKGFGFIENSDGSRDVFLHISAFRNRYRRPEVGQQVTYALSKDEQGRLRASNATLPGDRIRQTGAKKPSTGAYILAGVFLTLVAASVVFAGVSALFLWGYLGFSLVTFLAYGFDKIAAKEGKWRTAEATLHWFSLFGGWPGALVAQQSLRHKSKKQSFRTTYWMTVILNVAAFIWFSSQMGAGAF